MLTLVVHIPLGLPGPTVAYPHALVQAEPDSQNLTIRWAPATLLPKTDKQTETVALVPAGAVSWHQVSLPAGLFKQPSRLKAALQGALEERLLDEPSQLHMALQPDWQHTARPWVAVCNTAWLVAHLQTLEQTGLPVHRIVPEFEPGAVPCKVRALGDPDSGWLWTTHPERGVWGLQVQALRDPEVDIGLSAEELRSATLHAEPAIVAWANDRLGARVQMSPPGQHWLAATTSRWDLAQFELRASTRTRRLKNWQRGASTFWHSRQWGPARWGLGLLLAAQLLGLNAWAWITRADWQAQQKNWAQLLRETFPQTQVVIDAPVQMAREVERLSLASGQLSASDLEPMLAALGRALPAELIAPEQWTYQSGQLRLQGFKPSAAQQQALQQALAAGGYGWRADGDAWLISLSTASEAAP